MKKTTIFTMFMFLLLSNIQAKEPIHKNLINPYEDECGYFFYVEKWTTVLLGTMVNVSEIKGRYKSIKMKEHDHRYSFDIYGPYHSYERAEDSRREKVRHLRHEYGDHFSSNPPTIHIIYKSCD